MLLCFGFNVVRTSERGANTVNFSASVGMLRWAVTPFFHPHEVRRHEEQMQQVHLWFDCRFMWLSGVPDPSDAEAAPNKSSLILGGEW